MNILIRTDEFAAWLNGVRDAKAKARIISRLDLAALGNLGDCGPGYRVYFFRRELRVYVVLGGGEKSTQKRDIKRAIWMAQNLKKETKHGKGKK